MKYERETIKCICSFNRIECSCREFLLLLLSFYFVETFQRVFSKIDLNIHCYKKYYFLLLALVDICLVLNL